MHHRGKIDKKEKKAERKKRKNIPEHHLNFIDMRGAVGGGTSLQQTTEAIDCFDRANINWW